MEHSTVMQLVQMRGGTQHSYEPCANEVELVQMRGGTQYNTCYVACVDDVKLVQIRGETQYNYVTCVDEGWNTVQLRNLYK